MRTIWFIVLTLVSVASLGSPVKSIVGGRHSGFGTSEAQKTAKDYVQDGLVAMWDGIENAGWGTHDSSATSWKDLIGSANLSLAFGTDWEWFGDSLRTQASVWNVTTTGIIDFTQPFSVEFVQKAVTLTNEEPTWTIIPQFNGAIWYAGIILKNGYYTVLNNGAWNKGQTSLGVVYAGNDNLQYSFIYAPGNSCDIYRNGTYLMSAANGSQVSNITVSQFGVGGNARGTKRATDCLTHNMRIYSRALTAEEIAHNYAVDKARFNLK